MSSHPNATGHCGSTIATLKDERVTVAVLTHNRLAEVERTLAALLSVPEPPPVIVVDNASSDGTQRRLSARSDISYIRLAHNVGAAARNVAVRQASTRYVALCDDDTWWEAESLRRAADILDRCPRHALLVSRVLVGESGRVDPTCEVMATSPLPREPDDPGPPLLGFLAGASIVRRDMFLSVGGFSERLFIGGEEALVAIDFAMRGFRMSYVCDLTVHHFPSAHRDASAREFYLLRNALWTAWLRRSPTTALASTLRAGRAATEDWVACRALASALRGLPWVLSRRRQVPARLERQLRALERD